MSTTFARSCDHWSEARRQEMEHFYALAWIDYQHLAQANDWVQWLEAAQRRAGPRPLQLLDVACGSGKFPRALLRDTNLAQAQVQPIEYALLDPAAFSVEEARAALAPPFVPGDELVCTLQDFAGDSGRFDVVWATHALYAVPLAELDAAMARFVDAMGGRGFIAHSSAQGHYIRFYEQYLQAFRAGESVAPYTTAEQIIAALERLGVTFRVEDLSYANGVEEDARELIEGYLQRCVFDDDVSLAELLAATPTADYLRECRRGDGWSFQQHVKLIYLEADGALA